MQVELAYGKAGLTVELPDANVVRTLRYRSVEPLADPRSALDDVLARPTGCESLSAISRGRSSACILVCDITRPVPNAMILEPVLREIEQAGVPRDQITILIATGLHRPNEGAELIELVGEEIASKYRVENHFGERPEEHVYLGDSPRGVPIWIDRRYVEADLKITIGLIEPHFMAGYSGGRKLICPGIASIDTIRVWHGPEFLEHPRAATGCLDGNPVHEENTWIAKCAGCDFIVNVVLDEQRRPAKFVAGDMEAAFYEGVEFVRNIVVDTVLEPVDIVVTSSAGYPLDATFYQIVKGMVGAMNVVRQGGTVIIAAQISEGVGSPPFQQIFEDFDSLDAFHSAIMAGDYFKMDQWQLEEMAKVCRKARVRVVSEGIDADHLRKLWVDPAATVEQATQEAIDQYGPDATIAVIPEGPYVICEVATS